MFLEARHTPPTSHQGKKPLLLGWQVLEEDSRIQDEIAASAESAQTNEKAENDPIGRGTSYDGEDGADYERDIEGESSSYDVCRQAPEQSSNKHTDVDGDGETILEARIELVSCLGSNDTLNEKD